MSMPRVLFLPDRFSDYRMWSDIPDRLAGRAEAVHYDLRGELPWAQPDGSFVAAARPLAGGEGFAVVAAAGQAARFGFAAAEAGLARGLALFSPALNSWPEDLQPDLSELAGTLEPCEPIVAAARDDGGGLEQFRDALLTAVRETAGPDLPADQIELALAMYADHAGELYADVQATTTALAEGRTLPDPPWLQRPWFEHLTELQAPVTVVVPVTCIAVGQAVARRATDAEIVIGLDNAGFGPAQERQRTADALLRLLDRAT